MTRRTNTTSLRSAKLRRASVSASALLAAGAVAAASCWLGAAPTAQADPGDTVVPIGSSRLVQSEDLEAIQVTLDTERVVLGRNTAFSACVGKSHTWTSVLKGSPKPISAVWTRSGHGSKSMTESIAQAKNPDQAELFEATLVSSTIQACLQPKHGFHYGPIQFSGVGSGYATWALTYSGNSHKAVGGVAVVHKGNNVGFVQVNGTWGPADQMMESVAKVAVDRLG